MIRRAAKVDANHAEIVKALRAIGVFVHDTSGAGKGYPDICAMHQGKVTLIEIKDGAKPPSERKLTTAQTQFHGMAKAHGVAIPVVESVEQAIELFNRGQA